MAINPDAENFKRAQKAAWTEVAEGWHSGMARLLVPVTKRLIEFVAISPENRVLDVACGDGSLAIAAAEAGAHDVTASDLAPSFGAIIERRAREAGLSDKVHFREA